MHDLKQINFLRREVVRYAKSIQITKNLEHICNDAFELKEVAEELFLETLGPPPAPGVMDSQIKRLIGARKLAEERPRKKHKPTATS